MTPNVLAVAKSLIAARAEADEAKRPIDRKIAHAAFEAQCKVLGAAYGNNGFVFTMAVVDAFRAFGPRPSQTAFNEDRRTWAASVEANVVLAIRPALQ